MVVYREERLPGDKPFCFNAARIFRWLPTACKIQGDVLGVQVHVLHTAS